MKRLVLTLGLVFSLVCPALSNAGVVTFTDIDAFRAAAGPLVEIDFTVLPDGSVQEPLTFVDITPEFNYTDWGVTFSSPWKDPRIIRHVEGATLLASAPSGFHTWIEAEFEPEVYAVGVTTRAMLSVYDRDGDLVAQSPSADFIGFLSDIPITLALIDNNSEGVAITSILFEPVPEPATILLLGAGAYFVARRRWACKT